MKGHSLILKEEQSNGCQKEDGIRMREELAYIVHVCVRFGSYEGYVVCRKKNSLLIFVYVFVVVVCTLCPGKHTFLLYSGNMAEEIHTKI